MELLAPAGHWEAMVAAVQNGADAVYMGYGDFNARRGAKNFTREEFEAAVAYCHLRGVKVYLTLNTLLSDRELRDAEKSLRHCSRCGADGVIIQDWGLAALAREIVPDLPIHGSTQMTVHSLDGVLEAARLGMKCVVLGRELSGEAIRDICARSPIKIETFAHGALCVCWSGQCAMSAMIGGRSGNRGTCAQPCRLPYKLDDGKTGKLLSLKDACLAEHLRELREMGVSILKLEGRMKRPEYVAVIVRIYASLLKEDRMPSAEELRELERAFSRDGFTQGYWEGRPGPHMLGSRKENAPEPDELFKAAKAAYDREDMKTIPLALSAVFSADGPSRLTAADPEGRSVTVEGPQPEAARNRAMTEEDLAARLAKTGGTAFRAETVSVELQDGLMLPASAINALRRDALDRMAALRSAPPDRREAPCPPMPQGGFEGKAPELTVSLSWGHQLSKELIRLAPARIDLPLERIDDFDPALLRDYAGELCAALPRIFTDREKPAVLALLEKAKALGCTAATVQNLGQAAMLRGSGLTLHGDFGLNVFNSRSLEELVSWGLSTATVSFELRHEQIRDLKKPLPCEAIVYGRLPLMVMENCVLRNTLGCKVGDLQGPCKRPHTLSDRKGEGFPVQTVFGCRCELENAKTLFLADKPEWLRCGLRYARLRFTTEDAAACAAALARYQGQGDYAPDDLTRGLFYRGVE